MYLAAAGAGGDPPPPNRPNRGPPSKPGGLTPRKDKRPDRRPADTEQAGPEAKKDAPLRKFMHSGHPSGWSDADKLALFNMVVEQGMHTQPLPPSAGQRMSADFLANKNERALVSPQLMLLLRGLVSMHVSYFFLPCNSSFAFCIQLRTMELQLDHPSILAILDPDALSLREEQQPIENLKAGITTRAPATLDHQLPGTPFADLTEELCDEFARLAIPAVNNIARRRNWSSAVHVANQPFANAPVPVTPPTRAATLPDTPQSLRMPYAPSTSSRSTASQSVRTGGQATLSDLDEEEALWQSVGELGDWSELEASEYSRTGSSGHRASSSQPATRSVQSQTPRTPRASQQRGSGGEEYSGKGKGRR